MLYVKSSRLIENTNLNETQNNQCGTLTQLLYRKCFKLHSKVLFILITTCVFLAYVIFANLHIICIGKINDLNKKLIAYHHWWSTGRVFILKHFASKFMGKSFLFPDRHRNISIVIICAIWFIWSFYWVSK